MRNILSHVGREAQHLVGAAVRSIFNEPDQASAHRRLQEVAEKLAPRFPRVRDLLLEAAEDVLAYMAFPEMHRRRLLYHPA
jgi:putative transposase